MLRSALKLQKFAIVFFEEEEMYGVVATSSIFEGLAAPEQYVRLRWDRKNPNVRARVIKLGGKIIALHFLSENDIDNLTTC